MKTIFVAALLGAAVAVPAHAVVIPNTGTGGGGTDPFWSVMWRPLDESALSVGALANAPLVPAVFRVWQPNVAGNNWIGATPSSSLPDSGSTTRSYEYAFTTQIDVSENQTVTGAIGFDNFFVGGFIGGSFNTGTGTYTPGTQFVSPTSLLGPGKEDKFGFCRTSDGFLPSESWPTCTVNFAFALPAGEYDITFVIQGDGVTDGFILNQQGVTVVPQLVPEPGVLALMALGFLALSWRRRRARPSAA